MLKFFGSGSAFNTDIGNNAAYLTRGDILILFDCGSSTFHRIKKQLHSFKHVHVIMTHLHPDHCGSLGDLVYYMFYKVKPHFETKLTVHAPFIDKVILLLDLMGVTTDFYTPVHIKEPKHQVFDISISPEKVEHYPNMDCYAYFLQVDDKLIYFSGDSNMIPEKAMKLLLADQIDYFYQDTCQLHYENNPHISIVRLEQLIPKEYRSKVYCMHFDETFDYDNAVHLGFNIT